LEDARAVLRRKPVAGVADRDLMRHGSMVGNKSSGMSLFQSRFSAVTDCCKTILPARHSTNKAITDKFLPVFDALFSVGDSVGHSSEVNHHDSETCTAHAGNYRRYEARG
jgi:hypothetical protein